MSIQMISKHILEIDGERVYKNNDLWKHTEDRVLAFKKQAKDDEDFKKKMVTRLKRIKHKEKLYYTVAVLHQYGYVDIANMYTGRIVMDKLTEEF